MTEMNVNCVTVDHIVILCFCARGRKARHDRGHMMFGRPWLIGMVALAAAAASSPPFAGADEEAAASTSTAFVATIDIDWSATLATTRTTPTCQVVVEPPMWPTSKIRETQLHWLSELGPEASPVFWQSWWLYPHTAVAELQPGQWDFTQITPLLQDMLNATHGRELVLQFGKKTRLFCAILYKT